ncbi:MAG: hypothetical protein QXK80_02755 [Candidatus Pacearchaeota archaeon]
MTFWNLFEQYWDRAITGFIGGLVLYFLTKSRIKNKFCRGLIAFLIALGLVGLFTLIVWLFKEKLQLP